jgi:hypothetical protein
MSTETKTRPLIPARCPVTFTHLCADNDVNGNPRRCWIVTDHQGRHVETLDEGYVGEGQLQARYPWTSWHALHSYGFAEPTQHTVYPQRIDVSPSEYKRMLRRESHEGTERIRAMADRNERRAAKRDRERYGQ